MGDLDQLAKLLFAEETELVTGGAALWLPAMEIGLSDVRLDGLLRVKDPARITALGAPWNAMQRCDEAVLEVKMPGDHLGSLMLQRALLRRQARHVRRLEDEQDPWDDEEPLWIVAPHVPELMTTRRTLSRSAPGCYEVGPSPFQFLWIAANELPLRDDLMPFLIARSGRRLVEFLRWAMHRRPPESVMRMIEILPVPPMTREELLRYFPRTQDPEILARRRQMVDVTLEQYPEFAQAIAKPFQEEARRGGLIDGRLEGRLEEGRRALCLVLAGRGLPLSAEDAARIEACGDLETLERWLKQAGAASSVTEALR